jgi:hypothetical protein
MNKLATDLVPGDVLFINDSYGGYFVEVKSVIEDAPLLIVNGEIVFLTTDYVEVKL